MSETWGQQLSETTSVSEETRTIETARSAVSKQTYLRMHLVIDVSKRNLPPPEAGPAKIKLALCVARVVVRVPDVVTGLPLTLNMAGIDKATLVTVPLPGPMFVMVIPPAALVIWMPDPAVSVAAATDAPVEPM